MSVFSTPGRAPSTAMSLVAGENHVGQVGGHSVVAGGSFSRPADTTAYSSGDLVANATAAGSVAPIPIPAARVSGGSGIIVGMRLSKSGAGAANAAFRVHLFRGAPTTTAGDNSAFSGAVNGVAAVGIGYTDLTLDQVYSDGAKGYVSNLNKVFTTSGSANIYALLEARAAYTPTSGETFTLALETLQD